MIKTSYFATPYLLDLVDIDTKPLIDYAYKLKETSQGRQSTNLNSWQSFDLDKNESILQHLLKVFTDNFFSDLNFPFFSLSLTILEIASSPTFLIAPNP